MTKRDALVEAHRQAALCIRQHLASASDGFADDGDDSKKVESALKELADRHQQAVWRLTGVLR